jgi:F-box domain
MNSVDINYFTALPNENVSHILRHLNGKEIVITQLVCARFNQIIKDPDDLSRLRVKKYFSSFESLEGTFEEKCLSAVNMMKVIEKLLASGIKRINQNLYKANEDVYLYICNGVIQVLKNFNMLLPRCNLIAVAPALVFKHSWWKVWVILTQHKSKYQIHEVAFGGQHRLTEYEDYTPEEIKKIFSNRDHFLKNGYQKLRDCSDPSREIYLKHGVEEKIKIAVIIIKDNEIKILATDQSTPSLQFDGDISGLKELSDEKVVFSFENEIFESSLEFSKKNINAGPGSDFNPIVEARVHRLKNKIDLTPPLIANTEKSGFVIGGQNSSKLILTLGKLAGKSITHLEKILKGSKVPLLGNKESLLKRMARDQKVVEALRLTHQQLILPFVQITAEVKLMDKKEFEYCGLRISMIFVKRLNCFDALKSPFEEEKRGNFIYEFKNLTNKKTLSICDTIINSIRRFGFYGGLTSQLRVSPKKLFSFFNIYSL